MSHVFQNGYCIHCGCPEIKRLQVVRFVNSVELHNGDVMKLPSPIYDAHGNLAEGSYYAEIKKKGEKLYEAKLVGEG